MMKKILFIWPHITKDGGGEVALVRLLEKLSCYYDIDLLCYEHIYQQNLPSHINIYFASEPKSGSFGKIINKFKLLYELFNISKNYELLVLNDIPFINLIVWFVSLVNKSNYIIWAHSCRNEMLATKNRIIKYFYKKSLVESKCIVAVSNYAMKSMESYLSPQFAKTSVIYNVLLKNKLINKEFLNLNNEIVNIVAVGRLAYEKNFRQLVEAINLIKNEINKPIHLYICGDGVEHSILEQDIINYQLEKYITLVGYTANIDEFINQSDILVSTSLSEALPTVVFEGLLYDCALIVTNTGAAEIVEDGKYGIVIERNNVIQLSNALVKLINDDELRIKYQMNARFALTKFDNTKVIGQWRCLLESLIKNY